MKRNLLSILLLLVTGCGTTYQVSTATDSDSGGIHYFLPKTLVKVTLPVTKITAKKGRFDSELDDCFPDQNSLPQKLDLTKFPVVMIDSPVLETLAEPDTNAKFFIDLTAPKNPFTSRSGEFNLNEFQILTSAKATGTDSTVDFILEAAESVVAINKLPGGTTKGTCDVDFVINRLATVKNALNELSTDHRVSIEKGVYDQKKKDLLAEQAQLVSYFIGEKTTAKYDVTIVLEPPLTDSKETIGLLKEDAAPVDDQLIATGKHSYKVEAPTGKDTYQTGHVNLVVTPYKVESTTMGSGHSGLRYRVPGSAKFTLRAGDTIIKQTKLTVAQYGYIAALPRRHGLIKSEVNSFTLDPSTGALTKVAVNGAGLSSEQIGKLGQVVVDDRKDTAVADLEREKKILTLRKEISELKKAKEEADLAAAVGG